MAKIIEQYNIFKSALLRWLTYVILAVGPVFLVMAKEMTRDSRAQMDWFDWLVFIVSVGNITNRVCYPRLYRQNNVKY